MKKFVIFPLLLWTLCACQPQQSPQPPSSNSQPSPTQPLKVITPDWSIASTLTAMGYPPIATGDTALYREWVSDPKLPSDIVDIGERFSPNFERLAQLPAESNNLIIIDNDFYVHLRPSYGATPHTAVSFIPTGERATWQDYVEPTLKLGEIIHEPQRAEQFLTQSKQRLEELGKTFRQHHPTIKKIAVVQFADANSLRLYSDNSLFRPTFDEMGLVLITLKNQVGKGNQWGFVSLPLGDLAKLDDDTCLAVIEPFSPMLRQELNSSLFWQRLGFGANRPLSRCMTVLPPLWTYGGVSSMVTFGERLNQAQWLGGNTDVK